MKPRILLIEDDIDILSSLGELLELEGFQVDSANNGAEGLAKLSASRDSELPNLILLDVMMPVMDGVEFRSRQRRDPRLSDVPVIILSADGRTKERLSSGDSAQVIWKPINIDDLLKAIGDTVTSRQPVPTC